MRLETMSLRDSLDIAWSYIVDEGGEFATRNALREWIRTGTVSKPSDDDAPEPIDTRRSAKPRGPNKKLAEGFVVSQDQIDAFGEMGGTMVRKKPRRANRRVPVPEPTEQVP